MTETGFWALHINGPDDVIAMPDKATAEAKAKEFNELAERHRNRPDARPDVEPHMSAEVMEWEWSPEEHDEALADVIAEGEYLP